MRLQIDSVILLPMEYSFCFEIYQSTLLRYWRNEFRVIFTVNINIKCKNYRFRHIYCPNGKEAAEAHKEVTTYEIGGSNKREKASATPITKQGNSATN